MMAVMNALDYDAMTLGNHEFNFGGDVFKGVLGQADFPVLGANVSDTGAYGLAAADGGKGVQPYIGAWTSTGSRSRSSGSRTTGSRTTSCRATSWG